MELLHCQLKFNQHKGWRACYAKLWYYTALWLWWWVTVFRGVVYQVVSWLFRIQYLLITGPPPQVQLEVKWHPPLTSSQWEHTLLLLLRIHPATFQLPVVLSASFVHHLPAQSLLELYCNYADWQSLEPSLSLWILTAHTFSVKTHVKMSSIVQPCKDIKMCCRYHGQ